MQTDPPPPTSTSPLVLSFLLLLPPHPGPWHSELDSSGYWLQVVLKSISAADPFPNYTVLPPGSHHILVIIFFWCDSCGFPLRTRVRCPDLGGRVVFSLSHNTTLDSVAGPPLRYPCTSAHSTLIPGCFTRALRPARATRYALHNATIDSMTTGQCRVLGRQRECHHLR